MRADAEGWLISMMLAGAAATTSPVSGVDEGISDG
jgi:hypothetical protein